MPDFTPEQLLLIQQLAKQPVGNAQKFSMPMPKPDPRWQRQRGATAIPSEQSPGSWTDRLPLPKYFPYSERAMEIPPNIPMFMQGLTPSRKNGDAIDFSHNPNLTWITPNWKI